MFQQTIQDLLAIAEAGPHPEGLLEGFRSRIVDVEPFESGEILAETGRGLLQFMVAPGLGEAGPRLLAVLGDEKTLRLDTAAETLERGVVTPAKAASLLVLRIEAPGAERAALVLGHSRAWSFAAAPLSRLRAVSGMALRLLLTTSLGARSPEEARLAAEVARLRVRLSTLDDELVILRAERAARQRSDKPQ